MDGKTLIPVRNRNNGFTGYEIKDRGIWRNFAPGETKNIQLEELQQLQYQPGGDYILNNLLVVENKEALKILNMEVEPEYNYTEADIRKLLLDGSLDQLMDFLDFAPEGAIEIAKDIAVKEEIPDVRKRDAISNATGFNINSAINVNHAMAEEEAPKEEPKKERRAATVVQPVVKKERRAEALEPTSAPKLATPKYKVVDKK